MISEFRTIDAAWLSLLAELLARPSSKSRAGNAKELVGCAFKLEKADRFFLCNKRRALSPRYACAEFLWYMSGTKSGSMIKAYAPQYGKFLDKKSNAYGAYGYRLSAQSVGRHQLATIADELKRNPESRQCVAGLWTRNDLAEVHRGGCPDIPCTIAWQFTVRDEALHMGCYMRSNDVWLGLPYDVFCNCCVMRLVANMVGVEVGSYSHHVGSMHLYDKNWSAAMEAYYRRDAFTESYLSEWPASDCDTLKLASIATYVEKSVREGAGRPWGSSHWELLGPMYRDCLIACYDEWAPNDHSGFDLLTSPALKEALCSSSKVLT